MPGSSFRTRLSVLGCMHFCSFGYAAVTNVFRVKGGTTMGGCDAFSADVASYFDEAVTLITSATTAFNNYNTDPEVQKIAQSFFGIQPASDGSGPATPADVAILNKVTESFSGAQTLVNTPVTPGSPWIFCNSDIWTGPSTNRYRFDRFTDSATVLDQDLDIVLMSKEGCRGGMDIPSTVDFYASLDVQTYTCVPVGEDPNGACTEGLWALSGEDRYTILCPLVFTSTKSPVLDTSRGEGTYLDDLEPRSLTIVHEMFHLAFPNKFPDLLSFVPPLVIPITLQDETPNPSWPGDPSQFISSAIISYPGRPADLPTDLLLLALMTPHQPVEYNPQTYAWASVAIFLAKNGAMLDYSTGRARPLGSPAGGVAGRFRREFRA